VSQRDAGNKGKKAAAPLSMDGLLGDAASRLRQPESASADRRSRAGDACAASHDVIAELDDTWGVTGSVTVNVEPFPMVLSASMDPPKSSVNCFTI